jgi:hypothetical protein
MQLFAGPSDEFVDEGIQKTIAERLGDAFYDYYRFRASASEFMSWQNSLRALATQLRYANVRDHGVVLEMQLPLSSSRLDCLVFGHSKNGDERAVLIELKQWTEVAPSEFEECVEAFVGGAVRKLLHPSAQALRYAQYLEDTNSAFDPASDGITLKPCAWLHNMHPGASGVLRSTEFTGLLKTAPLYDASEVDRFTKYFDDNVGAGNGLSVMDKALSGKHRSSRKLLENTAKLVAGEPTYRLIDDQVIAFEAVLAMVRRSQKDKRLKSIVVVKGGPGTGKSVIALNLLGTLSKHGVQVHHATGSKAFTENLWRILGARSKAHIKYFNNFGQSGEGEIDVLLADEAHRIRTTSNNRFTPAARKSNRSQVDELVDAAKVSVFFIDDHQSVRPGEVGSTAMFRETAMRIGARYEEVDLRTQFRCAGSDEYIDWLDQLLEVRKTGVTHLANNAFEFKLVATPTELEDGVKRALAGGFSARMMAGYCWPWSDPDAEGRLANDVTLGDFSRPWNAKPDARRLARGIPKSMFWATDPGGIEQVGCIYTAQGFEFDYAAVIWGLDLVIRDGQWVGQSAASRDHIVKTRAGARFVDCVKNTYRVLLTRGLRGVALYVIDDETRRFIESRSAPSVELKRSQFGRD